MKMRVVFMRMSQLQKIGVIIATAFGLYWMWAMSGVAKRLLFGPARLSLDVPEITATSSLTFKNGEFILQHKPLTILSGAMHYFRVPRMYWKDRMMKMKACGLNTLETYVAWNVHEPMSGYYDFKDNYDIREYVSLAQEAGLYVILRPGPYICAEWEFGGLPSWLLRFSDMKVRTNSERYMAAVRRYFKALIPQIIDLQFSQGGPIIMVQVENEFGSYSDEKEHMNAIKEELKRNGIKEMLVRSDGLRGFENAHIPGALITVNFKNLTQGVKLFKKIHDANSESPLMTMEFWPGWFDHWGQKYHLGMTIEDFGTKVQTILQSAASINFYMFHGGTNFGFMNGANEWMNETTKQWDYLPTVTSYDYNAPLSEAGDVTDKFTKLREILLTFIHRPEGKTELPPVPPNSPKANYGEVKINTVLKWNDMLELIKPIKNSNKMILMEMLDINSHNGQSYGYIVYRHKSISGNKLSLTGRCRDRAQILINSKEQAVFNYSIENPVVKLRDTQKASVLDIVVENLGRTNYARKGFNFLNEQRKGFSGIVVLDETWELSHWDIYPLEFNKNYLTQVHQSHAWEPSHGPTEGYPALYGTNLVISGDPSDTFLNMKGWVKGVVFINGFNLGRYWDVGPHKTLYVPAPILKKGQNEVLVFEQHASHLSLTFQDTPELGEFKSH